MEEPQSPSTSDNLTGRVIGDYRVLRLIGSGGMADVYLAEQQSLQRQVALKVLHSQLALDASYVQRFTNEARAAAALVHPNIVQIYEVGEKDKIHFIAQEYVPGKNLAEVMTRQGAFQPGMVLDILRQVVSALCKAQELAIIHRDIKPENILFSRSGEVKVADFGLARIQSDDTKTLTQVGVTMGTPLYMSPEQIEGRPLDIRSDLYSLGITCYHLLTGSPPHNGDTALAIAVQHLNSLPKPLENVRSDMPSGLARMIHRLIAKKPEQRPSSPQELLGDLRKLATEAQAAGWAEGPGNWSLVEWIATEGQPNSNQSQLGELMQEAKKLQLPGRRWSRVAFALFVAVFVGLLVGAIFRPRFQLAGSARQTVPHKDSIEAQLFHARYVDSEAAWQAAADYEGIDPLMRQLAQKGLVRCYLLVLQEDRKALRVLKQLDKQMDPNDHQLRAFVNAGLYIAHTRLGNNEEATDAYSQLDTDAKGELRRSESQILVLMESLR